MFWKRSERSGLSPGRISWNRFIRNPLALSGFGFIVIAVVISILGYLLTPDSTPHCNQQLLELATRKPGFKVTVLKVRVNREMDETGWLRKMAEGKPSPYELIPINSHRFEGGKIVVEGFSEDSAFQAALDVSLADVVFPLKFGEPITSVNGTLEFVLSSGENRQVDIMELVDIVNHEHITEMRFLLGTDRFGRDLLSRLLIGTRISLSIGFISVFISLLIGILLGSLAGYFRGWVDHLIMWLINVVWSIPTLLMVIAITLVIGKGFWQIFIAVGLTMWVEVARVVRGQVLGIREKEYIEAARALGFGHLRILFRHILPNAISPVIIISAANFASAILIEAGLSFLGIGVQPPVPSWGNMIKDHYGYIIVDLGYLAILPGIAIMLMVLSFTMIGNGLRDALDTRTD